VLIEATLGIGSGIVAAAVLWGHDFPHHFGYYVAAVALLIGLLFGMCGVLAPPLAAVGYGVIKLVSDPGDESGLAFYYFFLLIPAACLAISLAGALLRAAAFRVAGLVAGRDGASARSRNDWRVH
jgi:hypothetical protein